MISPARRSEIIDALRRGTVSFSWCLQDDEVSSVVKSRLLDWRNAASIMEQAMVVSREG